MALQTVTSTESLSDAEVRTLAQAKAKRVAQSLSGRLRHLFELATGSLPYEDEGATPLNPDGDVGGNGSGPPWGTAFVHPMWVAESTFPAGVTGVYGHRVHATLTEQGQIERIPAVLIQRGHFDFAGCPYSRARLVMGISRVGGSGTGTITVRVFDEDLEAGPTSTATMSINTAGSSLTLSSIVLAPLPRRRGIVERIIEVELTSTVGVTIRRMSLNQVARRSHF